MPNSNVANSTKGWNVNPLHVGLGYFSEWETVDKFGKNPDVDTTFETVNPDGIVQELALAETIELFSADANDTLAGTGAQKIETEGLDSSFNRQTETVDLNGLTSVFTIKQFLRFFRARVVQVGSNAAKSNIGDITLRASVTTTVSTRILADEGQTQSAVFAVPFGEIGFLEKCFVASDTNNIVTAQLRVRPFGEGWQVKHEVVFGGGHITFDMAGSGEIPAKSDIEWRAKANNPNNEVTAGFKLMLFRE